MQYFGRDAVNRYCHSGQVYITTASVAHQLAVYAGRVCLPEARSIKRHYRARRRSVKQRIRRPILIGGDHRGRASQIRIVEQAWLDGLDAHRGGYFGAPHFDPHIDILAGG